MFLNMSVQKVYENLGLVNASEETESLSIKLYDLLSGGELNSPVLENLRKANTKSTVTMLVHPFFYTEFVEFMRYTNLSLKGNQTNRTEGIYRPQTEEVIKKYDLYLEELKKIIFDSQRNNIPIIIFMQTAFKQGNLDSRDQTLLSLQNDFQKTLGIQSGEFFVIPTIESSPAPLFRNEVMEEMRNRNPLLQDKEIAMNEVISALKQQSSVKKVLIAGSYLGGMIQGMGFTGSEYRLLNPEGGYVSLETGSHFYLTPDKKVTELFALKETMLGHPAHPLQKATIRGCVAITIRALLHNNIHPGVSYATFPEQLVNLRHSTRLATPSGEEFVVTQKKRTHPFSA